MLVGAIALGLVVVPVVSLSTYVRAAREIPAWRPSGTELPSPNGYDDFLAAGARVSSKVQSQVSRGASLAQYRALLSAHREALQRLRQGLTRESRVPFDPSYRGLVELNQFRALNRMLIAEGDLAAERGRYDAAVDSYLDALRFGTEMPRGGFLVYSYRGLAFQQNALAALDRVLVRLDEPARSRLMSRLAALDRRCVRAPEAVDRQTEVGTAMLREILQYPDPLQEVTLRMGGASTTPPATRWRESWELRLTARSGILQSYRDYMAQVSHALEQPYYQRPMPPAPRDPISRKWLEGSEQYTQSTAWESRDFNWRVVTTRLAIEQYRSRRGTLPASLKDLVPGYLPKQPQDPFAPHPLVYQCQGSGYRLYSRGPDGDDDGGRNFPGFPEAGKDGDLVALRDP
jgi:hypothetical protein